MVNGRWQTVVCQTVVVIPCSAGTMKMVTAIKATDYERWEEPDPPEEKINVGAIESGLPDDAYHALPPAHVAARLGTDLEDGLA